MESAMIDWTSLFCALLGALIGTYFGTFFINRAQQKHKKNIRKIAISALDLFKNYDEKTYQDAASEFNTKFNITEKRIIIVALYKIGVPIIVGNAAEFSLNNINFVALKIKEKEILNMQSQIISGNCDNLFFEDPEEYFTKNLLNNYKRSIAIKFIEKVLKNTTLKIYQNGKFDIVYPEEWWEDFSLGEIDIALVLKSKLSDSILYDRNTGKIKQEKIDAIINEIKIELWDAYLYWTYESFFNVISQNDMAKDIKNLIPMRKNEAKIHGRTR